MKKMNLHRIENDGIKIDISPVGASIVNFFVEDKYGKEINIVLGYDNEDQYRSNSTYFGAVVGPVANRISMGVFTLDGVKHSLSRNEGTNHLHGGDAELNSKDWDLLDSSDNWIVLSTSVAQGEGGYYCDISFSVIYLLKSNGELCVSYKASPSMRCPISLSQHAYFNLNGSGSILDHSIRIDADEFLPLNLSSIPKGKECVNNTAFDFRAPTMIGEAMNENNHQISMVGGFDHCWILNNDGYSVSLYSKKSGLSLEVKTDLPGIQLYTGNSLTKEKGRGDVIYDKHHGLCLETQFYPNQINTDEAEKCIFDIDRPFSSTTTYKVNNKYKK